MKVTMNVKTNLKTGEVGDTVKQAGEKALVNVIVAIASDIIKIHPWKTRTGNNSRSIAYGVGKTRVREGKPVAGKKFNPLLPPGGKLQGVVYSTSGYGGYLETGTAYMPAFPYFKPALDRHIHELPGEIKAKLK